MFCPHPHNVVTSPFVLLLALVTPTVRRYDDAEKDLVEAINKVGPGLRRGSTHTRNVQRQPRLASLSFIVDAPPVSLYIKTHTYRHTCTQLMRVS